MNISAILWDYDGTLVNTNIKNFLVNKEIYLLVKKEKIPEVLQSFEKYKEAENKARNWKELYEKYFGFSQKEIEYAASIWGDLSLKNKTSVKLFEGILELIKKIKLPQGICSQNCSNNIKSVLKKYKMDNYFQSIIGYKDISFENQKPHHEGFILCLEKMKIKNNGIFFYVGDHKEDVQFAKNAEEFLRKKGDNIKILTIAACYSGADTKKWDLKPDYEAYVPSDIYKIIFEKNLI